MGARTTVRIDDDLMRRLKERAARENVSITKLMNQALRQGLTAEPEVRAKAYREKTYDLGEALIDVNKATSIAFEMEDEDLMRKVNLRQ